MAQYCSVSQLANAEKRRKKEEEGAQHAEKKHVIGRRVSVWSGRKAELRRREVEKGANESLCYDVPPGMM